MMMTPAVQYGRLLFILRHAKSAWDDPGLADKDRPLNSRGWQATAKIAAYMAAHGYCPDGVFCSTARRTLETWQGLEKAWGTPKPQVEMMDKLYLASPATALQVIQNGDDRHQSLLMIGHNPGWGDLALGLSGNGKPEDLAALRDKFPTAALAVIGFESAGWATITWGEGWLLDYQRPNHLPARS